MHKMFGADALDWRQVKIDWDAVTEDLIKAGTPIDKEGRICNDGNVYGILMDDVQRKRNKQARVVISGCVDLKKLEEHSGIKLSQATRAALPDVWVNTGDWDSMENKPFGEYEATTDTLTWDGNTEGRDALAMIQGDETITFAYKVSDVVPTPEDLSRGIALTHNDGETWNMEDDVVSRLVEDYKATGFLIPIPDFDFCIIPYDNFTFSPVEGLSIVAPSAGVYFGDYRPNEDNYTTKLTIKGYNGFTGTFVKTIEPKFLPEGYPYEEAKVTDISGQEYVINGFDGDSSNSNKTVTHNLNIPLALGQVWKVFGGTYESEVQKTEDGTLYIGTPDLNPFYITANEAAVNGNWQYMKDVRSLDVVCVSGEYSETTVHPIAEKFLPNSGGGGGGILYVDFYTAAGATTPNTCAMTATEIIGKIKQGFLPVAVVHVIDADGTEHGESGRAIYHMNNWVDGVDHDTVKFQSFYQSGSSAAKRELITLKDSTVSYSTY